MSDITSLLIISLVIEGIVERIKIVKDLPTNLQTYEPMIKSFSGIIVGILLAFGIQLDYTPVLLGKEAAEPWVGYIITGIAAGLGSSFIHDVMGKFRN